MTRSRSRSRRRSAAPAAHAAVIPTAVIPSVEPADLTPREVRRELHAVLKNGAVLATATGNPTAAARLTRGRYAPTALIELFDTKLYLTEYFQTPALRFFVAYVYQASERTRAPKVYPRIIYKDGSLVWRCASHMISSDDDFWVGKGDVCRRTVGNRVFFESVESTTDLPFEMQTALETLSRRTVRVRSEKLALQLVLRNGAAHQLRAYTDFTAPRQRAASNPKNLTHGGRRVARFRHKKDPSSLEIVPGYEPDFRRGVLERSISTSVLYGGTLERFRILSTNGRIQYWFFSGPRQVWIIPPQATTTELSSFAVRTVDVVVDEDMCCPGYEYHYLDDSEDPPVLYSQIPEGFVGPAGPHDPDRADASPWLDALPIIRAFRRQVLGQHRTPSRRQAS